jgi:hypothetical protein
MLIMRAEGPPKKNYDVTYKVRTMQEIMDMQQKEVKKVQNLLEVPVRRSQIPCRPPVIMYPGVHRYDPVAALRMELGEASGAILE